MRSRFHLKFHADTSEALILLTNISKHFKTINPSANTLHRRSSQHKCNKLQICDVGLLILRKAVSWDHPRTQKWAGLQ
ncbi:unnamed protein product [Lactuca virosa]|uniref:Uncharacterized protein n=1 Tax=Lactuca virosa TaxID=75947 RepID=A0AAU9NSU5_9ASTR|nr:unnamed protein product [Lactuca virosa]CAH1440963.1 unnamed protein product [Lactuca virosa]